MSKAAEHRGLPEEERNLIQAQYEASGTIYGSSDVAEILEALLSFAGSSYAFGQLGLVEPDAVTLRIVAEADASGVRTSERYRPLSDYPAYDTLAAVEVLNVENVSGDSFLTDAERERLIEQDIQALLLVPLVVGQRLIGLLAFWSGNPVSVSTARRRALRSLADQAAVVFENQSLLRNTEATLDEVRTLYDINRAMLGAQHMVDVLHLLRRYLAPGAASVLHIGFEDYPYLGRRAIFRYRVAADGEGFVNTALELPDTLEMAESPNVVFVEDAGAAADSSINIILRGENAASYVLILNNEADRVEDIIGITFEQPVTFDSRTRRLYLAVADQIRIVLENQRLLRDTQANTVQLSRQVRVLQAVNRLATGGGSFNEELELLKFTIREMTTSLDADHGGLMMFDPEINYGTVTAEYPSHNAEGVRLEMRGNALFEALREDPTRPFIVYDVEYDPRVTPETLEVFRSLGIQSMMMVPIMLEGKLIASAGLDLYTRERQFTPEMIELAQTMGAQLSIGLQNIRLLVDAQRRADQLQRIAMFSQSVQATLDLPAILTIMLNESRQMLPIDRIRIAFYDAHRREMRLVGAYEDDQTKIYPEHGEALPLNGTLVAEVWETQQPLYIGDSEEVSEERRAQALGMRSLMISPIRSRGQVKGVIQVGNRRTYSYSETDIALFQQMIAQFAVALENSEAYAQSQRIARNQASVNEIAAQYQEVTTVDELLRVTLEGLSRSLGAQRGVIRLVSVQEVD